MGTQKQGNGFELGLRIRSGVEMGRGGKGRGGMSVGVAAVNQVQPWDETNLMWRPGNTGRI